MFACGACRFAVVESGAVGIEVLRQDMVMVRRILRAIIMLAVMMGVVRVMGRNRVGLGERVLGMGVGGRLAQVEQRQDHGQERPGTPTSGMRIDPHSRAR